MKYSEDQKKINMEQEFRKVPGIYREKPWEISQIKANVSTEQRNDLQKNFGIDADEEIKKALRFELEMGLNKTMFNELNNLLPVKRKLAVSVAEESPSGCDLIMSPKLGTELQHEREFESVTDEKYQIGGIELIGRYKGKNIYVFPHLGWDNQNIYQITSDFIEYKFGKEESKTHQILYYKVHSISSGCKKYEVEETLHV